MIGTRADSDPTRLPFSRGSKCFDPNRIEVGPPIPSRAKPAATSGTPPPHKQKNRFHHASRDLYCDVSMLVLASKTKAERDKKYKRALVDPDHVLYYDLATGCLDDLSIGTIYGLKNLYRDASNPSNVIELEEKLSATFQRRDAERLRKFLFVMHYRNLGGSYFDPDHPGGGSIIQQWLERFKAKHQCQTHADVWLSVLRLYLDTPHSQIAMAIYNEHGIEKVHFQMPTNVDPNMESYEALAYQLQAGASFLCIWEAHDTSEFILASNGLGLWEGVAVSGDHVHHVFVASPRIVVVLQPNITPVFEKMDVGRDGAITFLGKERMLRTTRTFCHDQVKKYDRQKFISLMRHLSVILTAIAQAPLSYDPVDVELYTALMKILLYEKLFPSRYDQMSDLFRWRCVRGCTRLCYAGILSVGGFIVDKDVVLVVSLDWVTDESAHVLDKIPGVTIQAMRIHIL
ncbi:hypothetical protein ARMGADRAFT_1062022 [Armillaria gallica]|uniref:Uncharacterized protein n=1 Tax=Armillaria gallica TaxID=47427 RepID=A0A2H3DMT7_ARMGA|nr:hypothetical protein ARMGADRAFT_1062022 [Armillaria gallica]